jgi:hypothetical protein
MQQRNFDLNSSYKQVAIYARFSVIWHLVFVYDCFIFHSHFSVFLLRSSDCPCWLRGLCSVCSSEGRVEGAQRKSALRRGGTSPCIPQLRVTICLTYTNAVCLWYLCRPTFVHKNVGDETIHKTFWKIGPRSQRTQRHFVKSKVSFVLNLNNPSPSRLFVALVLLSYTNLHILNSIPPKEQMPRDFEK